MIEVRPLGAAEAERRLGDLAAILADCVAGGASVGFMPPFGEREAAAWWPRVIAAAARDEAALFGGVLDGRLVGTVQLGLDGPCNQRHRGDVRKLLVHRSARRRGLARELMGILERQARERGLRLLTLDTCAGSEAEGLYPSLGYTRAGTIPGYALWPDGRPCDTVLFWKAL